MTTAPAHIGHGSRVTTSVHPVSRQSPVAAADDQVQAAAAGTDLVIGATQDVSPALGERVDVAVSGVTYITAGAAITRGARLMSDASGRVITAAAAAGSNVNTVGIALESASAAGDVIRVLLNPGTFQG